MRRASQKFLRKGRLSREEENNFEHNDFKLPCSAITRNKEKDDS